MDRLAARGDFLDRDHVVPIADSPQFVEFTDFYVAQYGPIVRVMRGLTGRQAIAEELAQEAMIATFRNWNRVRTLDNPKMWLRRVAVNRAISAHRRLMSEIAAITRVRAARPAGILDEYDDELWAEVRLLPRRQAVALVLWAVDGLTQIEIAEVLGVSPETAHTHIRRARETLQYKLGKEE